MNVIYKITNLVNNKVYIGQTTQGLVQRKREHICRFNRGDRNHKLYLAMKKHGIENFIFEEVCSVVSPEYLDDLEKFFIAFHNSFTRGYNMTIGGDSVSEETRQKISKANTGRSTRGHYHKILESRAKNTEDRRQKYHLLLTPDGTKIVVRDLKAFCRANTLTVSNFYSAYARSGKSNKGYYLLGSSTTSSFERTTQANGVGNGVLLEPIK